MEITESELKAKIDAAVNGAIESAKVVNDEATAGIKAKNAELIARLAKAKASSEINPADHAALEIRADELEAKVAMLEKSNKELTTGNEKAAKELSNMAASIEKDAIERELTSALLKSGVTNPGLLAAARALHTPNVVMVADGDKKNIMLGDKAISEAITEWSGTDDGKHFVTAAANSGGAAPGGKSSTSKANTEGLTGSQKLAAARAT